MRIAITGATGFLGRHLIRRALDDGHQVTAWYRSGHPDLTRSEHDRDNLQWVCGELGNIDDARCLVQSADAVIHGGLARGGKSFLDSGDDPLDYWNLNATGSLQLLETARAAGVKKFLFISSGAVHDTVLPDRRLDENHPMLPGTLYGACKAAVESLVHHYGSSGKLCAASLRPPAIYGVADPARESKWFQTVQSICEGSPVEATGGSKSVHADDVAKAAMLLLHQGDRVAGQTYNCCDRMISDFEVATLAKRLTGSESLVTGVAKTAKHEIDTSKIESLGMRFGGTALLEQTIAELIDAVAD